MRSCTTSTNAATSWSVTSSRAEHIGHEGVVDLGCPGPAEGGVLHRHHAQQRLGLGGQQLDLEPQFEAGGVGEQGGHVAGE